LRGALGDDLLANAMQTQDRLLFVGFDRNKGMAGRLTASQMASASLPSFLPFRRYGMTKRGAIMRASWPRARSALAQ
jgi:hypothetical protein